MVNSCNDAMLRKVYSQKDWMVVRGLMPVFLRSSHTHRFALITFIAVSIVESSGRSWRFLRLVVWQLSRVAVDVGGLALLVREDGA